MRHGLECYRRHLEGCDHRDKGQHFTLCDCPIWAYGYLHDTPFRRSMRTNSWERAVQMVEHLERGRILDILPVTEGRTVSAAVKAYVAEMRKRNLRASTIRRRQTTLDLFCELRGETPIARLSVDDIVAFRDSREVRPRTQVQELETLRTWCAFCIDRDWLESNPAKKVRPPKVEGIATLPFQHEEVLALLDACGRMRGMWESDAPVVRRRARALVLVLLYSGLRVGDVAKLRRSSLLDTGHLVLRVMKTGVPLKVLLHPDAVEALHRLPVANPTYFFWSGHGDILDCCKSLHRTIARLGKMANVHAHPHRFRDTFAVQLLTNGADIRTVQELLGHQSLRTTEKHYAHFVPEHQKRLDDAAQTLDFTKPAAPPVLLRNNKR